jgi:mono/diheme cytochrome c family protein
MRMTAWALAALMWSTVGHAETPLERGRYLVEGPAACGNCHTPKGSNGLPIADRNLGGGAVVVDSPAFRAVGANLTPDRETGLGRWSDTQIIRAIREGVLPDGSLIGPPMPFELYRRMSDADVAAIVAYLRAVPAVSNKVEKSVWHMALPPSYGPPVDRVSAPSPDDTVAYGAYLAGPIGHCVECHSPLGPRGRDFSRIGAGGQVFEGPWGVVVAANITSSRTVGLGAWSDAEIERAIREGVAFDGRKLTGPMAFAWYKTVSKSDMTALIAYLRSIPAIDR